jgi:hypothetical protein
MIGQPASDISVMSLNAQQWVPASIFLAAFLAMCTGIAMGRPPKLTAARQAEARRRRAEGATLAELARSYCVGKSKISRL